MNIKSILQEVENQKSFLDNNRSVFEILEGNLLKYVKNALYNQLNEKSANRAIQRSAPINVLTKMVNKLSALYIDAPTRITDNPQDQELIDWYSHEMGINSFWNDANKSFNAYKCFALELYENDGKLKTRSLPMHTSLPFSSDEVNPMNVTEYLKIMPYKDSFKLWIYSDNEFLSVESNGNIVQEDMIDNEGINPYGVMPIVYKTKSRYLLVPLPDTDTLKMTILLPILMTDLNFSSMFLSNPIIWTINADSTNFEINPNTYLDLQGIDPESKPEIGVLKPEPNIDAQLALIKEQLALWLQSKNIKASAIGKLDSENLASGVALMIQEMDTTEDRKNQIPIFQEAEQEYWYKLAVMHNDLANRGMIKNRKLFSNPENLKVNVIYTDQSVPESMIEKIDRLDKLINAGLMSKRGALKELYPLADNKSLDEMLLEIEKDNSFQVVGNGEEIQAV